MNILDKHFDKDVALNEAKKDFINRFGYYDPALWSGFILVGDDRPIVFRPTPKINIAIVGFCIMVLITILGLFFYRRKKE